MLVAVLVVLMARPGAAQTGPDPLAGEQYGLIDIKAPQVWEQTRGGGMTVAVVSTGIANHEDLDSQVDGGFDATGDSDPRKDTGGRGTHLAGIVGAAMGNGKGIAGVAPEVRLIPYKAFQNASADDTFIQALDRARGARVVLVDVPADYSGSKDTLRQALKTIGQRTSVVVGAQSGLALDDLPVLAVAATGRSGGQAAGAVSGRGVSAPGDGILSTSARSALLPGPDDDYEKQSGTGQAAAHVAGAVAILRALGANPVQAADALRSSARKSGNADLGAGIIDVAAAVAAYKAPPPPPSTTTTAKPAAAAPTTIKPAAPTTTAGLQVPSSGPVFDAEPQELGSGEEEAVPPPNLDEFIDSGDQRGPSILIGGRERPWGPLTLGFGLLFGVGTAMSITFRRLGAEPT